MTATNGWPDKLGVPLNPERDQAHWLRKKNGQHFEAWRWDPDADGCGTEYSGAWAESEGDGQPEDMAKWYSYHGPCLTPDQATALQARVAELEKQNDMLRHATDKLRAMVTELNARHEPLQRAFITAVELLNDAALEGGKDE